MARERITIIGGTGDQGKGLALRWARAGFEIVIGSRAAERAEEAAKQIREIAGLGSSQPSVSGALNGDAAAASQIVVVTVPFAAQAATLDQIRETITPGTVIVDVTVPLAVAVGGKITQVLGVWDGSAAEQCARIISSGSAAGKAGQIDIVSAFHNVSADLLENLDHTVECDVLVCGDKKAARERLRPLVEAINGCRYVDGGPLSNSRTVEAVTALLVGINIRYKTHAGLRITGLP
jgi:NADPH-dependent F420 reductase